MGTGKIFQYQRLAEQLIHKIESKELPTGIRLLALRQFAEKHQISLNTAKNCYGLLEANGWIEAKEKQGYFVREQPCHLHLRFPEHSDFVPIPREVSHIELQNQIEQAANHRELIHLGAIQLSPHLIPIQALQRSIQRALKHAKPEDFLYSNAQGHPQLRQALSEHWAEDGIFIPSSNIYISNGCMPALAVLLNTFTDVGDAVIVPTPNFNGQLQLLASLKRKIIEIPAHTQGIDLVRLEQAMQHPEAKACLLTANYQNPLGFCLTQAEKQHIVHLAHRYQCLIIEDDIYAECSHSGQRPLPLKYWDQHGDVVYSGSISKSLSPAYRVGWFCLPERLKEWHAKVMLLNVMVNIPLQLGLADLIYSRAYRQHIRNLHPHLKSQVQQYIQAITDIFADIEIRLSQPQGGYAIWLQLPDHVDGLALYYFAQSVGINIVPGILFGADARYNNCIRLNAGHALTDEIYQALEVLADWVRA